MQGIFFCDAFNHILKKAIRPPIRSGLIHFQVCIIVKITPENKQHKNKPHGLRLVS